jgi:hypothetical protein
MGWGFHGRNKQLFAPLEWMQDQHLPVPPRKNTLAVEVPGYATLPHKLGGRTVPSEGKDCRNWGQNVRDLRGTLHALYAVAVRIYRSDAGLGRGDSCQQLFHTLNMTVSPLSQGTAIRGWF